MNVRRCRIDRGPHRRRGMAPLELVLCLPVLVGLLAMIFTLSGAGLTRSSSAIHARQTAWVGREEFDHPDIPADRRERYHPGELDSGIGAAAVGLILRLRSGYGANGGLLEGIDQRRVPGYYPAFAGKLLARPSHHVVLAGSWDQHRLGNRPTRALVPYHGFGSLALPGLAGVDLSGFGDVASSPSDSSGQLGDARQQLVDQIERDRAERARLRELLPTLTDPTEIARTRERISHLSRNISTLEEALRTNFP